MLQDCRINISLPKIESRPLPVGPPARGNQQFVPVIRTRRYNLLKIKELCQLKEKDRRLGRVKTESSNLQRLLRAQCITKQKHENYQANRNQRYKQMHNQSYFSLMEKIRYDLRYWSLEK